MLLTGLDGEDVSVNALRYLFAKTVEQDGKKVTRVYVDESRSVEVQEPVKTVDEKMAEAVQNITLKLAN